MVIRGGITMGYFDDAKAAREEENSLEHSSGPWKKHKYTSKKGEGKNARYYYSTKGIDTNTVDRTARDSKTGEPLWYENVGRLYGGTVPKMTTRTAFKPGLLVDEQISENFYREGPNAGQPIKGEKYSTYSMGSLPRAAMETIKKGKDLIKDFFTPKTKVTASSNLTGKETIDTKPAEKVTLKKNKLSFKKK